MLLANKEYEFINFNIFGPEREMLKEKNPTLKVPMFVDEKDGQEVVIFDSGVTYRYLAEKFDLAPLTLEQQNLLSIIDACNDSLVNTLILKRSSVDTSKDKLYFNIQRERQQSSFDYLEKAVKTDAFSQWNYLSICMVNLVQWAQFRSLYDFADYPNLLEYVKNNESQPGVQETLPQE